MATTVPQQVVRSSSRIPKEIPILLIGSDLDGKVFSESTNTVLLSLHGAGIVSHHKLSPEQELLLRCPDRNIEAEIRVVGQLGSQQGIYTYGVAFVDPSLQFWDIDFPPMSPAEMERGLLSLVLGFKYRSRVPQPSGFNAAGFRLSSVTPPPHLTFVQLSLDRKCLPAYSISWVT